MSGQSPWGPGEDTVSPGAEAPGCWEPSDVSAGALCAALQTPDSEFNEYWKVLGAWVMEPS